MKVRIDNKEYDESSLTYSTRLGYENLKLLDGFETIEELTEFLLALNAKGNISSIILPRMNFINYIIRNLLPKYKKIFLNDSVEEIDKDIRENVSNVLPDVMEDLHVMLSYDIDEMKPNCIIISPFQFKNDFVHHYFWRSQNMYINIPLTFDFEELFPDSFKSNHEFEFRNLVELCMIVKNGGELFQQMLEHNLDYFDYWTIVDTGSTDNTVSIIENVLIGKKPGKLHFCDFEDFSQARNYSLKCCERSCKYIIILDDTYFIHGDFRSTLNTLRGDLTSDAYSVLVDTNEISFPSTRIIKSKRQLYYTGKVHETIRVDNDKLYQIGKNFFHIVDRTNEYMVNRSKERITTTDIPLLLKEIEDSPFLPRNYYYIANSYRMFGDYQNARTYYMKRLSFVYSGDLNERWGSAFELGRMIYLSGMGDQYVRYLKLAQEIDSSRPESDFVFGVIALGNGKKALAFDHFKKAFELGIPTSHFSSVPVMYQILIPEYLLLTAMDHEDLEYAGRALERLEKSVVDHQKRMFPTHLHERLAAHLKLMNSVSTYKTNSNVCFLVPFGWSKWDGNDFDKKGIGGSETFIIQLLNALQSHNEYNFHVFCNCDQPVKVGKINYHPIETFLGFLQSTSVKHLFINRDTFETTLACRIATVQNVYIFLHDYTDVTTILDHPKLKHVIYISNFQKNRMEKTLCQSLQDKGIVFYYGIDSKLFKLKDTKRGFRFIYSSLLNRGLVPLLKMWTKIFELNNNASLHVFCDLENEYVKQVSPEQHNYVCNVKTKMEEMYNVVFHGFVGKEKLYQFWDESDFWLYPCIFEETFCLTALEAAVTKTLIISTPLAALTETVDSRGFLVEGNPLTNEWQTKVIELISNLFDGKYSECVNEIVEKNYRWALSLEWENRANDFLNILKNNYILHRNSISFVDKVNFEIESFLRSKKYKNILVIGDKYGVATEHFLTKFPDCNVKLIVPNNDSSSFMKENLTYHAKSRYDISTNLPFRCVMSLIRNEEKFDLVFLNELSTKMIEITSYLLPIGGNVLVEPISEPIVCENLSKVFENETLSVFEKNFQKIEDGNPWKTDIPFYFQRDRSLEAFLSKNMERYDNRIVEFGVGNSTSFYSEMKFDCLSFVNELSEEYELYISQNCFEMNIKKFQDNTKWNVFFEKECVLLVNDTKMLTKFLENKYHSFGKVTKVFLSASVESLEEINNIRMLLSKEFQLQEVKMGNHNICRFDYYQFWKRKEPEKQNTWNMI